MTISNKLRRARELQPGRLTQQHVATMLGLRVKNYQKYENGIVTGEKTLEPLIIKLSAEWEIPEGWWYDGKNTDPYDGGLPSSWAANKPIRVYHATSPEPPAFGIESSHMAKIEAAVAALNPIAMEVPDNRMGKRIPSGWTVYGVAKRRVLIGKAYLATHKQRKVIVGAEDLPELILGIYVAREGGFFLEPPGDPNTRENCLDLNELHLIVARSWSFEGDESWMIVEKALRNGLPMRPLPVTLGEDSDAPGTN